MAYATKYLFKWESVNGTTREIRVLLDGYSGSVVQRRLGRAPVLKKQHNGNVYGTSLEFYAECAVDGEFAEFYTTDPKAYRVDLYSGNTLLWQGYITPELYAEPDIAPPYDVQVIATDGVGELKLYDFAPQGLVSLRSMLTYLLGYTGLTTDVYLISSIKPGGSGAAGSLLEKTINLDYMAGESCYEVLSYILDTLHATITWWKGAWILARETNVKFSSGKVQYFNTSGNAGTLAGSVVTLGKMYTNDAWPVGQLSSKIDPAKNSVRIQAPWHPVTALSNPDMTSDTGWTKAGGAVYDSTNKGYHLPEASLSAIPRISQTLALSSLKNPMTLAAKVTGVSADLSLSTLFTAAMGFYVTYEVSGTTYHLERSDEGLVWKQGAMPSLLNYTNTIFTFLKTFDEDRTGAQTVDIEIPPFLLNSAFPAGTLAVYVFGGCVRVYGASLDVIISKGYQDNLYLDNDARGEGDEVEIAIGRETSAISPYQAFLQGILLDSGSLITSFKDDYITSSGLDFMSFIARDYARSFALPRIVQTGTVSLESSVTFPPLVFTKGALDYWLEGYSWNMLDDELDISARSLPTATITVDSETVTEAGGTAGSAAQGGSSSGGGSMPSGVNYFEQDDDQQELIKLKAAYSYLGPKKGLIFDQNPSEDANAHLEVVTKTIGGVATPVLHSRLPFYSDGFVSGGGMSSGGGTGGIDLDAMWTSLTTTSDAHGTDKIAAGHIPDMSSTYGYLKSADLSAYATRDWVGQNYLPLSAGTNYPLTGDLYLKKASAPTIYFYEGSNLRGSVYSDSSGARMYHVGTGQPTLVLSAGTNYPTFRYSSTNYKIWHEGNSNKIDTTWSAQKLLLGSITPADITVSDAGLGAFGGPSTGWETGEFPFAYASGFSVGNGASIQIAYPRFTSGMAYLCGRIIDYGGKGAWTTIYNEANANNTSTDWYARYSLASAFRTNGASSSSGLWKGSYWTSSLGVDDLVLGVNDPTTNKVRIDALCVGISMTPTYKLDVNGQTRISLNDTAMLRLQRTSASGGAMIDYLGNNQSTNYWRVGTNASDTFLFEYHAGSSFAAHLQIGSNGHIGYGAAPHSTYYHNFSGSAYFDNPIYTGSYTQITRGNNITTSLGASDLCLYAYDGTNYKIIRAYCSEFNVQGNISLANLCSLVGSNGQNLIYNYSSGGVTYMQIGTSAMGSIQFNKGFSVVGDISSNGMLTIGPNARVQLAQSYLNLREIADQSTYRAGLLYDIGGTEALILASGYANATIMFCPNTSLTSVNRNSSAMMKINTTGVAINKGTGSASYALDVSGTAIFYSANAPCLIVKRNDASGAATINMYPDNQESYGWTIGANRSAVNKTFTLHSVSSGSSTQCLSLTTSGSMTIAGDFDSRRWFINANTYISRGSMITGGLTADDIGIWVNDGTNKRIVRVWCSTFDIQGNFQATGSVTAGAASDVRLKTNINTMSDEQAKALIMALRPVTFTWNQKATELFDQYKGNDVGFVAQDVEGVQNIIPGMSKAIGTIFEDYKRLDPVKFIAPMVKVAQNHETRIQQLERELAQVKSENKILRDRLNMS